MAELCVCTCVRKGNKGRAKVGGSIVQTFVRDRRQRDGKTQKLQKKICKISGFNCPQVDVISLSR